MKWEHVNNSYVLTTSLGHAIVYRGSGDYWRGRYKIVGQPETGFGQETTAEKLMDIINEHYRNFVLKLVKEFGV